MCPHKLFIMHLVQFIVDTIELGLEVILSVHANEQMIKSKLALQLQKLGLVEFYNCKCKSAGHASYFKDGHHVDGVWCTRNIVPEEVCVTPFHFGSGDRRDYEFDLQMKSMLGKLAIPLCTLHTKQKMFSVFTRSSIHLA